MGFLPDVGLVLAQPVGLAFPDGFFHHAVLAEGFQSAGDERGEIVLHFGLALVQPEDGRPQGLAIPIQVDHGVALGGDGHPGDAGGIDPFGAEQFAGCSGEVLPVEIQLLFGPAGPPGEIGFEGRLDHVLDHPPGVDQGRPDGLGAGIEDQDQLVLRGGGHGRFLTRSGFRSSPNWPPGFMMLWGSKCFFNARSTAICSFPKWASIQGAIMRPTP